MSKIPQKLGFKLNPNLQATSEPPIPLASLWASLYHPTPSAPLINLAQGIPGHPPPPEFLQRLAEAARDGNTSGYGDLRGDEGLREALARDLEGSYAVFGGVCEEGEVGITAGCNLAFYATMLTLAQAGDEIIIPTPWYFNHEMTLKQLNINIVPLPCSPPEFLPSPTLCRTLLSPRTKAIVLVTPNNPTGAIYSPELIEEFSLIAKENGIALVLDETYREFLGKGKRAHGLFEKSDWREYLIQLFSFSKSYAIPGHRLGSILAPAPFLYELQKTLDCLQICPARPAQQVVQWAIEGTREWREGITEGLVERGRLFRALLESGEWRVETLGGYFAYVKHPFPGCSSELVASRLAQYAGIVVLPGSFFNLPFTNIEDDRYLRFSIANVSEETLRLVPARLSRMIEMSDSIV